MTVESDIHAALMTAAETALSGFTVLWSRNGGDMPEGEFAAVTHLPNDNERVALRGRFGLRRQGFLQINLVMPLGGYEIVAKEKAGLILESFPLDARLTVNATVVTIYSHSLRQGLEVEGRWQQPILIEYKANA